MVRRGHTPDVDTGAVRTEERFADPWHPIAAERGVLRAPGSRGSSLAWLALLTCTLLVAGFVSLLIGRYPISPTVVLGILASAFLLAAPSTPETATTVVLDVRLPRVVAAGAVGGALAAAGATYQSLFKNPLASPGLLGVTSGSGFGAALALLLGLP